MADTAPPESGPNPSGIDALPFRLRALLEPKGFIKIAEFILAICMFSTTAGFASSFGFTVYCNGNPENDPPPTNVCDVKYNFSYPFRLDAYIQTCEEEVYLTESPAGSAQFFVAVGVLAMLYCVAAVLWYVVLEFHFEKWDLVNLVDFIVTCVFTLLMFIASCAWASGLNNLKWYTNYNNLVNSDVILGKHCVDPNTCVALYSANYASLGISVTFGFLNTLVWGGNVWFVWKETIWFRNRAAKGSEQPSEKTLPAPAV